MYIDTIKKDRINAIKSKNTKLKRFLDVLLGELELKSSKSDVTENIIIKFLEKMLQNAIDNVEKYGKHEAVFEIDYLTNILPKKIDNTELTDLIREYLITHENVRNGHIGKATGIIIKNLTNNGIIFDKKSVSNIVKTLLTKEV